MTENNIKATCPTCGSHHVDLYGMQFGGAPNYLACSDCITYSPLAVRSSMDLKKDFPNWFPKEDNDEH